MGTRLVKEKMHSFRNRGKNLLVHDSLTIELYHTLTKCTILAFLGIPMINHQHDEVVMVDDDGASCGGESSIYVHSMMSRTTDSKSTKPDSFPQNQIPDVALHLGDAYTANLASVKNDLIGLSLNDLYKEKAASVFLKKSLNLS